MSAPVPPLRAPPFPGLPTQAAPPTLSGAPSTEADRETLFSALRQARVGGGFWGEARPSEAADSSDICVRSADLGEASALLDKLGNPPARAISPDNIDAPVDPWSVLPHSRHLIAHGSDEWVAMAAILGLEISVLSEGPYGSPGDTSETLSQRAYEALNHPIPDPFGEGWLDPLDAIALLGEWRRVLDGNRGGQAGERIVAACGMSWWKRDEIRRFLWSPGSTLSFHRSDNAALAAARGKGGALAVWPSRVSPDLEEKAERLGVPLVRVEDGFVRSVGLGSNLVPPLSVIVDRQGIHYDPTRASDLETLLATAEFSSSLTARAARLREMIVEAGISKYAASTDRTNAPKDASPSGQRIVLVPGQVEDDMSVLSGGGGLTSNLDLLRRARALEPEAQIWWRPHPDVDAGHRKGAVTDTDALEHADRIVREGSMSALLDQVDTLHTITSLSGFEALMRGVEVTCHGVPFYAGWGLTRDLGAVPDRRGRVLSLDELVAGVLLLYPRYLDPVTGLPCPPETLIQRLSDGQAANRLSWVEPLRRIQGGFMRRFRPKGLRPKSAP